MGRKNQKKPKPAGSSSLSEPPTTTFSPTTQTSINEADIERDGTSEDSSGKMIEVNKASIAAEKMADASAREQTYTSKRHKRTPTPPCDPSSIPTLPAKLSAKLTEKDFEGQLYPPPVRSRTEPPPEYRPTSIQTSSKPSSSLDTMSSEFGFNPHALACISCNTTCLITNSQGYKLDKMGMRTMIHDNFIPIVCSDCEGERALAWLRLAKEATPPHTSQQYPGTISTRMLAGWDVYEYFKNRFGVEIDDTEKPYKRVTRARDWWREGVLTADTKPYIRITYFKLFDSALSVPVGGNMTRQKVVGNHHWVIDEHLRKDLFFGTIATGKSV